MTRSYASSPQMNMPFEGAKLAILIGHAVVTILRDDKPGIPYPNFWDLPGGGREDEETTINCVLRETHEELGLVIAPEDITWGREFGDGTNRAWFFVTHKTNDLLDTVRFGDEGQTWCLMSVSAFLDHTQAIPQFQERLRFYLQSEEGAKSPPLSS